MSDLIVNSIYFKRVNKHQKEWVDDNTFEEIPFVVTEIFIDKKNLIEHLKKFELPFANKIERPEIAGLYIGNDPSNHLEKTYNLEDFTSNSQIDLFQCEKCMSAICPYRLTFNMRKEGKYIYWFNFQQTKTNYPYLVPPYNNKKSPHQKLMEVKAGWKYDEFGPFVFLEENYSLALKELRQTISEENRF